MAQFDVTCVGCGKSFRAGAKHAKFCSTRCRVRANRKGTNVVTLGELADALAIEPPAKPKRKGKAAAAAEVDAVESGDDDALTDSRLQLRAQVIRELTEADRLNTTLGQQAVVLADTLCSPFDTGSAKAAVSKELSRVMGEALKGAQVALSPLDELRLRREQKLSGTA